METVAWQRRRCPDETGCAARPCTEAVHRSTLTGLYAYLHRNQAYLVNYDAREQANKTYTSRVAESPVDTLINARHTARKKCNGPGKARIMFYKSERMMAGDEWESQVQGAVLLALKAVA